MWSSLHFVFHFSESCSFHGNSMASPSQSFLVRTLFFGRAKELTGTGETTFDLPEGSPTTEVLVKLALERFPKLGEVIASVVLAVNEEYSEGVVSLKAGDSVAFIPPISGG